jgi:hypothetical protein
MLLLAGTGRLHLVRIECAEQGGDAELFAEIAAFDGDAEIVVDESDAMDPVAFATVDDTARLFSLSRSAKAVRDLGRWERTSSTLFRNFSRSFSRAALCLTNFLRAL